MRHFNELTPAEAERLAILAEECGEVVQSIGKILRHGYDSQKPMVPNCPTNRQQLEVELGDIQVSVQMLIDAGDLNRDRIHKAADEKKLRIHKFTHHQGIV